MKTITITVIVGVTILILVGFWFINKLIRKSPSIYIEGETPNEFIERTQDGNKQK